ncbi:MAG: transcription initiation factor IIB [Promethearchaeota archaeon]
MTKNSNSKNKEDLNKNNENGQNRESRATKDPSKESHHENMKFKNNGDKQKKNSIDKDKDDTFIILAKEYGIDEPCCNHPLIKEENGFFVCQNCGMVHEEQVFDHTPRRAFTQEEIQKRKSTEPVHSKIGPRTVIRGSTDARGSPLSPKHQQKYRRLAKIHRSLTTSFERNLWIALPNLQRLQERLNLSDPVAEDALKIYTHAVKKKLTMGRSIDTLLAASIFAALKIHNIPITIEEITKESLLPKKNVLKSYRLIWQKVLPDLKLKITQFSAIDYVHRFIQDLNLPIEVGNLAIEYIKKAIKRKLPIAGKDPKGLAAAAIYLVCRKLNLGKTQSDVANVAHVTEVTLRMRAKDLKRYIFGKKTTKKISKNTTKSKK